nr:hypothetical protein GCM10025699_23990 [Microbacterium flavescens]
MRCTPAATTSQSSECTRFLDLSSTNPLPGIDVGGLSYEVLATGGHPFEGGSHVYARLWNPTVARFEEALARLEHAEEAVAFSSGMAAVTAVLLALSHEQGKRHVVAVRPLYGGTDHLLASGLLGVEATYCTPDAVASAVRPDTALVILESPANPTLELVDIRAVVAAAGDVPVLVDNTFATPVLQHPLDLGAAISLHSATKYLGATATSSAVSSRATPRRPLRCVAPVPSPARSCTRSPRTCCTGG